jgi:cytochrome b6-f complex iron-sulfur subunit
MKAVAEFDMQVNRIRRIMINAAMAVGLLSFAGAAIYPIVRFLWPGQSAGGAGSGRQLTIPLADIEEGSAKIVKLAGAPVVVIRIDGAVNAVSAKCTHLGCIVKWEANQRVLSCPCHEALFNPNGTIIGGPAPTPLPTYPARIEGGQIVVGEA